MDAIMSVFEQTHQSFEIIVIDDGSTDAATTELLNQLDTPGTRVIHQENQGLPGARNTGIEAALGEFVVPLDADDELNPTYLETLLLALRSNPQAAFAHCWAELYGDVEYVWATRPFNLAWMLIENSVVGCAMIRTSALTEVGLYDTTMASGNEDWELWIRLTAHGWDNEQVRESLFRYRKHGHTMSVDTESAFEEGRAVVLSKSGLDPVQVALEHAPVLAYIGTEGPRPDGVTEIVATTDVAEGVRSSRAKFVSATHAQPEDYRRAVETLEADPSLANATIGAATVWRRWALLDRDAGHHRQRSEDPLARVMLEDWSVPDGNLMRQTPEVAIDAWEQLV